MSTPLYVFTIALDAMPWLASIYSELIRLTDIPWHWTIVEGAAMNVKDTKWCEATAPRLSNDGTTEFLETIKHHPRITVIQKPRWEGKVEQCNAALATFKTPGIVMQQDGDELWSTDQYRQIVFMFEDEPDRQHARFTCRYFVGPNIVTTDEVDWWRAWRYVPGYLFSTHEPPVLAGNLGSGFTREDTKRNGLIFDHQSWTLPKHVIQKERYYGTNYRGALAGWKRLQLHTAFPARIKAFFPWCSPHTFIDRVFK